MSKAGKVISEVAGAAVKASGMATKYGGEVIGEIGKGIGVSKDKCDKVENSADNVGKDLYYASGNISRKAEQLTDEVVDASKNMYQSVKDKFHS